MFSNSSRISLVAASVFLVAAVTAPAAGQAAGATVSLDLPSARRAEMTESLRTALSTLVDVELAAAPGTAPSDAAYLLTVEFPSGLVAPGELVLRRRGAPVLRARLTHAWDVVDPRAVGAIALSLVQSSLSEVDASAENVGAGAQSDRPASDDESERVVTPTEPTESNTRGLEAASPQAHGTSETPSEAEAANSSAAVTSAEGKRLSCGLCSDAILHAGWSFTHAAASTRGFRGELAFYGRLTPWASVGLRFSGGGGYSSVEGAFVDGVIGAPSVMVSHRFPLGRSGFGLELGIHTEAAIGLKFTENDREGNAVEFGLGVGAFAAIELGRTHGLAIDYTFSTFGLGGRSVRNQGALSLLYTRRWGAP